MTELFEIGQQSGLAIGLVFGFALSACAAALLKNSKAKKAVQPDNVSSQALEREFTEAFLEAKKRTAISILADHYQLPRKIRRQMRSRVRSARFKLELAAVKCAGSRPIEIRDARTRLRNAVQELDTITAKYEEAKLVDFELAELELLDLLVQVNVLDREEVDYRYRPNYYFIEVCREHILSGPHSLNYQS